MAADAGSGAAAPAALPAVNEPLRALLGSFDFAFTVSDCGAPDMPIVFASASFYSLTGYAPGEVLGRNCRFLQGPDTERRKVMEIRDALREDRCCQVCLTNYRKDGSKFLNQFFLAPIKDGQGIVTHYVGIQTDVSRVAGRLAEAPGTLHEQQAAGAVALGEAAGCRMCDVVLQQEAVLQQLAAAAAATAAATQGEEQPARPREREEQQAQGVAEQRGLAVAEAGSDDDADVVREEAQHAVQVCSAIEQSHPHAASATLPSSLLQPLLKICQAFVLADPRLPDCPIVHASPQFLQLTGYSREEVIGNNCRFLQGPGTDAEHVAALRAAISADPPQAVTVTLLNYKKGGAPFWNALHVAPVRDAEGKLEYFVGIQLDVSQPGRDGEPQAPAKLHLTTRVAHMGATGAARVACRGLSGSAGGLRRSMDHQGLPRRGYSRSLSRTVSGSGGGSGAAGEAAIAAAAAAAAAGGGAPNGAAA
ncbi:PHOT2 [Scenedesmus sp. PABB004]|nr:PHOT2 [Scenedesmus sp. PABB004]